MQRLVKKNIAVGILIVILIDAIISFLFSSNRSFSHLAVWNIIELDKKEDFYWQPEDVPRYFRFEPHSERTAIFRNDILPLIKDESDEFKKVITVAKYIREIKVSHSTLHALRLRWDSPEGMLGQIREGAKGTHCFHLSILFSTYLSSLGIKSRLWGLENDRFDAVPHTVTEVYIKNPGKWMIIDVTHSFYVTENGSPLSLLELREKLLDGATEKILWHNFNGQVEGHKCPLPLYSRLIRCVFLRANNDFSEGYNTRYGALQVFQNYLDRLPDSTRRGLSYALSRNDIFIHYVDRYSRSLKSQIIIAKSLFYFFILSLIFTGVILTMLSLVSLKKYLNRNLSRK